jgi:hypothetical protein
LTTCHVESGHKSQVLRFALRQEQQESQNRSNQVELLITNNEFCIVQRATAQSKTEIFRDYGVAEAPPGYDQRSACQVKLLLINEKK